MIRMLISTGQPFTLLRYPSIALPIICIIPLSASASLPSDVTAAESKRLTVVLHQDAKIDAAKVGGYRDLEGQLLCQDAAHQVGHIACHPLGQEDERQALAACIAIVFVQLPAR